MTDHEADPPSPDDASLVIDGENDDDSGASDEAAATTRRRMDRRTASLLASGITLVVLVALAALLPVPYVVLQPGPTFNTLGSEGGKPLLTITGARTYPTTGELNITTVGESGGPFGTVSLAEAFWGWLNPTFAVLPERLLYPPNVSSGETQRENTADFLDSQSQATAAALRYLHKPVEQIVQVRSVAIGGPSDGKLEPADVIVSIDGQRPADAQQAADIITSKKPGQVIAFAITRSQKRMVEKVKAAASKTESGKAVVGITVTDSFQGTDVTVTYGLQQVGGPSAGLMFSLGIVDKLSRRSLADGRTIAGTGTIDANGQVGPIGGVQQKVAGARRDGAVYFLTPTSNCIDADRAVPKGLTLVRVDSLSDAVTQLENIRAGRPTTPC